MKPLWVKFALLIMIGFGNELNPGQLFGHWTITAIATASPVTAMSGEEAARLVGHTLIIAANKLQFDHENCRPTYEASKESLTQIAQDYNIDVKQLTLPDPVARYDGDCTELFVPNRDRIVFSWKGFFLDARRSSAASNRKFAGERAPG
jgi:hypothetical protein